MNKFNVLSEKIIELDGITPGIYKGKISSWRWLQVGEMTQAGDWIHDPSGAPKEITQAFTFPVQPNQHPIARRLED